jgi:hypothetical protein
MGIASVAPIPKNHSKRIKRSLAMTQFSPLVDAFSRRAGIEFLFGKNGACAVEILAMTQHSLFE